MLIIIWFIKTSQSKEYILKLKEFFESKKEIEEFGIENYIDAQGMYEEGIAPYYDSSYGNNLLTINSSNTVLKFSNIRLQLKQNPNLEDGIYSDVLIGQTYIIAKDLDLDENTFINITSNEGNIYFNNVKQDKFLSNVKTSSISLSEYFNITTNNEIDAFKFLSPSNIEILNKIEEKYGFVNMRIEKETVEIIIKTNRFYFEDTNLFEKDFEELLEVLKNISKLK